MRIIKSLPSIGVSFLLCAACSFAAGLDYLGQEADAVVIATTESRLEGPKRVSLSLQLHRVLKGDLLPGMKVDAARDWTGGLRGPDQTIRQSLTGLWFLKKTDTGWSPILSRPAMFRTVFVLFLPGLVTAPRPPQSKSLTAILVNEVLAASRAGAGDGDALRGALDGVPVEVLAEFRAELFNLPDPDLQSAAVASMLAQGIPGTVGEMARRWPRIRSSNRQPVESALRESWRSTDPAEVAELIALAKSDESLRPAVAEAIAAVHTREALPFLVSLLDSNDRELQLRGLYGLSAYVNGCPVKTRDSVVSMQYLICTRPSEHRTPETMSNFVFRPGPEEEMQQRLTYWRDWWSRRGRSIQ